MPKGSVAPGDAQLGRHMLGFIEHVEEAATHEQVLDSLHATTLEHLKLGVLGAFLLPIRWGDLSGVERGKTVFLHESAPKGWWEEYFDMSRQHPGPGYVVAQLALAPFTLSETMRMLQPVGIDRWAFELAHKHGLRDLLVCPVGGRWVVLFWSRVDLTRRLSTHARAMVFMGATFAAIRLQSLTELSTRRIGSGPGLTPRELAVLRMLSLGKRTKETAELLEVSEETVRSHLKKAMGKFGVRNSVHAVAQAMRLRMIP